MIKILVTGGAGYIGSHVCKLLAARGYEPVTFDNLARGNQWAVKWGPLEVGDIADSERLCRVFKQYRPSALMHFAAYAYVGESVENPLLYYKNNVTGTATLLQALIEFQKVPVVFSSTCSTYGIPDATPIVEDHPQRPINPYGFSKLIVEKMLTDLGTACGLRSVALRYFNAAGADPDLEIGEAHYPETHLIPLVLMAARDGSPVGIFGNDYATKDGTCVRDYVHVLDIADAHVRALDYLLRGGSSCSVNLSNARGYSVMDVVATAERVCGKPILVNVKPRRAGDPAVLVGSHDRARQLLGWEPSRSDLEIQIKDAWNWMQTMSVREAR